MGSVIAGCCGEDKPRNIDKKNEGDDDGPVAPLIIEKPKKKEALIETPI